ncbi:hypothetical protein [Streptomyces sp. NPDC055107]
MAAALMVLIASLCALLPLGVYLAGGTRSAQMLGDRKRRGRPGTPARS